MLLRQNNTLFSVNVDIKKKKIVAIINKTTITVLIISFFKMNIVKDKDFQNNWDLDRVSKTKRSRKKKFQI